MFNRLVTAVRDVATYNRLLVRSASFRAEAMKAYSEWLLTQGPTRQVLREAAHVEPAASAHAGLSGAALALAAIRPTPDATRHINLVLSDFLPDRIFAGIHTALDCAQRLSAQTGLPVRLVTLSERFGQAEALRASGILSRRFGADVTVAHRTALIETAFHPDDVWVVTHWTTAHPAAVATLSGALRTEQIVYLIQDYEPGFHAWSTAHAVARATYAAGFHHLVNSAPLANYLRNVAGVPVDDACVFAPALDIERMHRVADSRRPGAVRVLFYGRPSKPRNLYSLGIAALIETVTRLGSRASDVEFFSVGEAHDPVDLGHGVQLKSLGALSWNEYFEILPSANVVLSLQASPHPSHPPLEAAISGAFAVTNEFEHTRAGLHDRLMVATAAPESLATALITAVERASAEGPAPFTPLVDGVLGGSLDDALSEIVRRL